MNFSPGSDALAGLCAALRKEYPKSVPLLDYETAFQLLIAVILSAQTTDRQVNRVTPELFSRYPSAKELSAAALEDVERIIYTVGFYRSKARHIVGAAAAIDSRGGGVPERMEELTALPGVGRKSASVILTQVYGSPALVVDTHVMRVCQRLGLVDASKKNANSVERALRKLLEEKDWIDFSTTVNLHGRACCHARSPRCRDCAILRYCAWGHERVR